ncbi:MAG: GNAT family N-acetyltransferase [Ruminococcus sp.]|nr:GNAT family N-acetyltransferase [Ruminococcus sp.]
MIQLRPYESRDARTIISWIGDEVAFRKWCADRYEDYPITAYDIDRQYASADPDRFFPMTAFDETGIVGHLIMRYTDEEKHILRFGFIIIDDKRRGQGIGGQMLKAAIRYAFEVLQANKITLGVFENNPSAYHCYRSVGFCDIETDNAEYYHIFDEDWKCLELELHRTV